MPKESARDVGKCIAKAVKLLETDILDRRGLKSEWRMIDDDVKRRIRHDWSGLLTKAFERVTECDHEPEVSIETRLVNRRCCKCQKRIRMVRTQSWKAY